MNPINVLHVKIQKINLNKNEIVLYANLQIHNIDHTAKNAMLKNIPLGRFAQTSDVATAVAFLASDSASMITGTSILVDGGWTAI